MRSSGAAEEMVLDVHRRPIKQPLSRVSAVVASGGKCHSYQWRTGGWSNNERAVWCQRSDGVNVTGEWSCGEPRGETLVLKQIIVSTYVLYCVSGSRSPSSAFCSLSGIESAVWSRVRSHGCTRLSIRSVRSLAKKRNLWASPSHWVSLLSFIWGSCHTGNFGRGGCSRWFWNAFRMNFLVGTADNWNVWKKSKDPKTDAMSSEIFFSLLCWFATLKCLMWVVTCDNCDLLFDLPVKNSIISD